VKRALFIPVVILTFSACSQTPAPPMEAEVTELRLMAYNSQSSRDKYLQYLNEHLPDINIIYDFVPMDNLKSELSAQMFAGQGPDIIEVGGDAKLLAKKGWLLDLTDKPFINLYYEEGFVPYKVDGKYYATPLQTWFEGIFYNKKIFREHGLEIPKTLNEFIQLHKTLSAKGIKPQTMHALSWEPLMKQSIGVVINEFYTKPENVSFDSDFEAGRAKLSEKWLPAVTAWYSLITEKCLTPDMLDYSYDQAKYEFANGGAAMWQCGPWAVNEIMSINKDIELGMFPIPGCVQGDVWMIGGLGSGLAVNCASKNTKQSLMVLAMTAMPEAQNELIKDNMGKSFVIGVKEDLSGIFTDCEEAFREDRVKAPWVTDWSAGNLVVEAYGEALQYVLAGSMTVEEALQAADRINEEMRKSLE